MSNFVLPLILVVASVVTPSFAADHPSTRTASKAASPAPSALAMSSATEPRPASEPGASATPPASCGDGVPNNGETCDDGNTRDGDGCDSDCTVSLILRVDRGQAPGAVRLTWQGGYPAFAVHRSANPASTASGANLAVVTAGYLWDDTPPVQALTCYLVLNRCGDGTEQAGEQCDDGNNYGHDGCRADCTDERCGDGILDPLEQCDDGNAVNDDGCSNACLLNSCGDGHVDSGEGCDDGNAVDNDACGNNCMANYCGDAEVNNGEACDDGNQVDTDACGNDCVANYCGDGQVNNGEACDDGNQVDTDACGNDCVANYCGDGQVNNGEVCDDGNQVDTDACGNDCVANYCGDGQVNNGEACDDGNQVDTDACGNDCVANYCGDGQVNNGEACDDGNQVDTDACGNDCVANYCGDGQLNNDEECDDGNAVDLDACGNDCATNYCGDGQVNNGEGCDDANAVDLDACGNDCVANYCGDGQVNNGEVCDDGDADDLDACGNNCLPNYCGDGQVNNGEGCDDGDADDLDACGNDCVTNFCGDGQVNNGEACDDGNTANGDACRSDCQLPVCGDGVVDFGEACDLGAGNSNAPNAPCRTDCTARRCGDGVRDSGEVCDDGNGVNGDACLNTCVLPFCGDGVVYVGVEECDDANAVQTDSCRTGCIAARCGDGILRTGVETCDDGNAIDGDPCSTRCRVNQLVNGHFPSKTGWNLSTDGAATWNAVNNEAVLNITTQGGTVQLYQAPVSVQGSTAYRLWFRGSSSGGQNADVRLQKHTSPFTPFGLQEIVDLTTTEAQYSVPFTTTAGNKTDGRFIFWLGPYDANGMVYRFKGVSLELAGRCGDAIVDPGEQCDDANAINGDGCQTTCLLPVCGDGVLDSGEECDDDNNVSGDGCQATCLLPACGDGVLDAGEECDDGNNASGDICRPDCTSTCGDGILDPGEICDLGAANSNAPNAPCRLDCQPQRCGDGVIDSGEGCEDGNQTNYDGCSTGCEIEIPVCGNGHQEVGEACDDGNNDPGDGCEPDCVVMIASRFRQPSPGDVYREYTRVMTGQAWRVTDPAATNPGQPGNSPGDFLPNPQLALTVSDLRHAVRAELLLDVWGGHIGTTIKRLRVNGNPYIAVPELNTTPTSGQCFTQQWNIVVDVPLHQLVEGSNTIEGTSGAQSCYTFNWGQWGWYGFTLRVYYGPEKEHPTGAITSPGSGVSLAANPTITVNAQGSSGVAQVDVLGYYNDVDADGDGRYLEYHASHHRTLNGTTLPLTGHIGTDTIAPFQVTWDTQWVPDQDPGKIRLLARIKGGDGIWYVTEEVTGLSLVRPGVSVKLYKSSSVPESFWVRDGTMKSSTLTIPAADNLANAQAARLVVRSWNGVDGEAEPGQLHYSLFNNWTTPNYGSNHFYRLDNLSPPLAELRSGTNTFTVQSDSSHHGIEVLWPGPQLLVRYGVPAGTCGNGVLGAGEQCDDGNVIAGDGCSVTCKTEVCGDGLLRASAGEECDDGNLNAGDGCSPTCQREGCGNGDVDAGEGCDDNNLTAGDGCSATCQTEYCGDGTIQVGIGEECDPASPWHNLSRNYRLALSAGAAGYARTNTVAEANLVLSGILGSTGGTGTVRVNSFRLVEVDDAGALVDADVQFQYEGGNSGRLVWLLEGATSAAATRHYQLYFDTVNYTAPSYTDQVVVTDGVEHDGQTAFQIATAAGTYFFQKEGASLSGLVDAQGNDWISYSSALGTAGEYRGIPNLVFPGDIYHPGFTSASSTLVADGPLRAVVESPSDDGLWKTRWEFYAGYARMIVLQSAGEYWFLYEGTPGGQLDRSAPNNDFLVHSDGTQQSVAQSWPANGQDIVGEEWVYFADPVVNRSLFLAHHHEDSVVDWYQPFDHPAGGPNSDWMTVFGFGRGINAVHHLSGWQRRFTIGLLNTTQFATAQGQIHAAYKDLDVDLGLAEAQEVVTDCNESCRLPGCGDGTVNGAEQCDDGNLTPGDGCDATCLAEVCGNGVLQAGEACDDGNTASGDGCSAACQLELDCGNGALDPGELCDDGNSVGGDGCSATCQYFISDDFDHAALPQGWFFINPRGDASYSLTGHNTPNAWLNIVVPSGVSHDAWAPNNAPRLMHGIDDANFTLETKIESTVTAQHQFQGIFVEQDGTNWLRFDVLADGAQWRVFAAKSVNGVTTLQHSVAIGSAPSPNPVWLRVTRAGDTWTQQYSLNGTSWTTAGSAFVVDVTVRQVGVFAGNATTNTAFTARFDYLFDPADPEVPEDGIACGNGSLEDGEECDDDNLTPGDGCSATCTSEHICGDGGLDAGEECDDGNLTPGDGCSATCTMEHVCGDGVLGPGELCDDGNTTNGDGCSSACKKLVSDDFSAPGLNTNVWTAVNPLGDATFALTGGGTPNARFEINVPGGASHDAWVPNNNAPRLMQAADNSNFDVITKMETALLAGNQTQGIFVEETANDWLRFDVYSNGTNWFAYAARRASGGTPTQIRNISIGAVPSANPLWLRVTRTANTWLYRYSFDGTNWIDVGTTFNSTIVVNNVGLLAGNAVTNPAFTARFDYFFNAAAPIVPEDPSTCGNGSQNAGEECDEGVSNSDAPGATCRTDCTLGGCGDGILDPGEDCDAGDLNSDDPGAPCRADCTEAGCGDGIVDPGETCDLGGANSDAPGATCRTDCEPAGCGDAIVDPGEECDLGGANSNAPDALCRLDCDLGGCGDGIEDTDEECDDGNNTGGDGCTSTCLLEAGCGNGVIDPGELCDDSNTVGGDGCSASCRKIVSDDFSAAALNGDLWTVVNPLADATFTVTGTGTTNARFEIGVPGGTSHDAWVPNNAPRIMQHADNSNFDVIAKLESAVSAANQTQGIYVEESANDWLRFDVYSNGTNWFGFAARRASGGTPSSIRNINLGAIPSPNPLWLRVTRTTNTWQFRYSIDGTNWVNIGATFNSTIVVNRVGLLAGNAVTNTALTARFDYFFNAAAPIVPEDPSLCGNGAPDAGEECDDGGSNSDLPGANCRTDCILGGCGDGILDPGEDCDAGELNSDDPGAPCRAGCTDAGCGDGIVDPGEGCDLGGANSEAPGATCRTDCEPAGCGDDVVDPGEQCDLGAANSNAPDADCRTNCTDARCGDLIEDTGETCDDGNTVGGDGCDATCLLETPCGDGDLDPGERCDDGNTLEGDGCSNQCEKLVSDDFSAAALNTGLWTVVDPVGNVTYTMTGTGTSNARLEIAVPSGVTHDPWVPNTAARLMQPVDNSNFDLIVKIESTVSANRQIQGIFVEESANDWLRFDLYSDGTSYFGFAARRTNGGANPTVIRNVNLGAVPSANPIWLRVTRTTNTWRFRYSLDGTNYSNVGSPATFTSTLIVNKVGLTAGNSIANPAFTGRFDYFFDAAAPIAPEDP